MVLILLPLEHSVREALPTSQSTAAPVGVMIEASVSLEGGKMPLCKECGDEVEALVTVRVERKRVKLCEDCADRLREAAEIAKESEGVVRNMMGFTGSR
jgi:hypothetical protein